MRILIQNTLLKNRVFARTAPEPVQAAFKCGRKWQRLTGGSICGELAETIVEHTYKGMRRQPRGRSFDFENSRGKRVQVKAIGSDSRSGFHINRSHCDRLIVLQIYHDSWSEIYHGPLAPVIARQPNVGRRGRSFVTFRHLEATGSRFFLRK